MNLGGLGLLRKFRDFKNASNRDFILKMVPKQSICAEVGVSEGKFTKRILNITNPSKLYLIDAWSVDALSNKQFIPSHKIPLIDEYFTSVTKTFSKHDNVVIIRGKSKDVLNTFPDSYFDWIYLDAGHFYDDVLSDLEISTKKVKLGGLIIGDDYIKSDAGWKDDVIRAVNDFTKKHNLVIKSFGNQFVIKNTRNDLVF